MGPPDTLGLGPLRDLSVKARVGDSPDAPRSYQLSEPGMCHHVRECEGV